MEYNKLIIKMMMIIKMMIYRLIISIIIIIKFIIKVGSYLKVFTRIIKEYIYIIHPLLCSLILIMLVVCAVEYDIGKLRDNIFRIISEFLFSGGYRFFENDYYFDCYEYWWQDWRGDKLWIYNPCSDMMLNYIKEYGKDLPTSNLDLIFENNRYLMIFMEENLEKLKKMEKVRQFLLEIEDLINNQKSFIELCFKLNEFMCYLQCQL